MSNTSYYAVIPASVRYDASVTPNAKLLYGEITALCGKEGYCWASNKYFADLYRVSGSAISEWVQSLKKAGHIKVVIDQSRGNERQIFLTEALRQNPKTSTPNGADPSPPKDEVSVIENNTKKNKGSTEPSLPLSIPKGRKRFTQPTQAEVESRCKEIQLPVSEAAKFINYYSSKGWKVGRVMMVCWKSALNTWKLNHSEFASNGNGRNGHTPVQTGDPEGWLDWLKTQPKYLAERYASSTGTSYRFAPGFMKSEFHTMKKKEAHEARS